MSEQRVISAANLSLIENNLQTIYRNIEVVNNNVDVVNQRVNAIDQNVNVVYNEVAKLAAEFQDYVDMAVKQHNLEVALANIIKIRQELEKKYGHYDEVRRTTTGILQADDLGIVRKDTISTATEELMISNPNYWLAPCLVAIAAWINNQQELAEKALHEAIKRNDEKTSLLFALICRRADRKDACLKWTQRYFANQDEENLDRKCIVIIDAFASGLLGTDSEGVISRQMTEWLNKLSDKPGFVEQQTTQWSEAINAKRPPLTESCYPYLKKYSRTWPVLEHIMEGAYLHAEVFNYLENIFSQEASTDSLKEQLDEELMKLVTDFDDEELPLRREEKFNQFIIDFEGDKKRAQASMKVEQTAFEERKNFTQLLTDAAMKPESSHAGISTQKFAIALSRDWIINAYNDVTAQNRMNIPNEIEINIDSFNDKTTDGKDERELADRFNSLVDKEKTEALAKLKLSMFEKYSLWGGGAIGVIGLIMIISGNALFGFIGIIAGIGLVINHFSKKKKLEELRSKLETQFEEKRSSGTQILLATLAEVVDFRAEFQEKDSESQKVIDYLEQISPEQYIKKLSDSNRRIRIS
ncbi:hypothetical protein JK636_07290 [Clostridium sp. YIM B02515]|uniref:Uncharacterized protein n=1 Tax=Clostridium rhizosphaerae TaxID=2803861 RepID=A0ABS1T8X7_9CLOT|nr:hypothetical protein [Clostridium rhizosphaerae]MBL4935562.1 hypothetical protein [Clostridium rhizosphaerae]